MRVFAGRVFAEERPIPAAALHPYYSAREQTRRTPLVSGTQHLPSDPAPPTPRSPRLSPPCSAGFFSSTSVLSLREPSSELLGLKDSSLRRGLEGKAVGRVTGGAFTSAIVVIHHVLAGVKPRE